MRIFVTGGAGYIGSHTVVDLLEAGHEIAVFDNFENGSPVALARVQELTGRPLEVIEGDIRDETEVAEAIARARPEAVIHFAGLKAVGESVEKPLDYYRTNVAGTINLVRAMAAAECWRIVFSSSATVYGTPHYLPYDEAHPLAPESPYGRSKLMVEQILADWAASAMRASVVLLRYFNPVGAHPSGRIGEDPLGIPNNLMPFIAQVAVGRREVLNVFGNDYDTPDGTGVRDYIHVMDLARAHRLAIERAATRTGCEALNVGTGKGTSVLEMVHAFERASGRKIPYRFAPRRPGDIAQFWADPARAEAALGWRAERGIDEMCASTWAWQSANPDGYRGNG